jgi:hypothetical protein
VAVPYLNPNTGQAVPQRLAPLNDLQYDPNIPNPAITFAHRVRVRLYVPSDTPDFYLTLGVRETRTTAACAGNGGVQS